MPSFSAACGDRLAVLVGAGEEEDILAALAHVAREHVGGDRRVGVAEVRLAVHVVDGRRDVVGHRQRCYPRGAARGPVGEGGGEVWRRLNAAASRSPAQASTKRCPNTSGASCRRAGAVRGARGSPRPSRAKGRGLGPEGLGWCRAARRPKGGLWLRAAGQAPKPTAAGGWTSGGSPHGGRAASGTPCAERSRRPARANKTGRAEQRNGTGELGMPRGAGGTRRRCGAPRPRGAGAGPHDGTKGHAGGGDGDDRHRLRRRGGAPGATGAGSRPAGGGRREESRAGRGSRGWCPHRARRSGGEAGLGRARSRSCRRCRRASPARTVAPARISAGGQVQIGGVETPVGRFGCSP